MCRRLRLWPAIALLGLFALLSTGCGKTVESAYGDFGNIYGNLAGVLETVSDVESVQAATPEIEVLVPRIFAAGKVLAQAMARMSNPKDVDVRLMMAVAEQQQRLQRQLNRLSRDDEVWPAIQPVLAKTMLLNAMPPR